VGRSHNGGQLLAAEKDNPAVAHPEESKKRRFLP